MIEYDVWPHVPDLTVTPTEGRTMRADVASFAPSPDFVSFPEERSERVLKFGFAWDVPRDWHAAKAFWNERGGRAFVFLMPTWKRDFGVSVLPVAGSYLLTVDVENYGETRLPTTRLDHPGRYVYCYDLTHGLHVAKVLESADDTQSVLTLEQAWPWAPSREALFGFLILVRFDTDESEWRSLGPSHVKAELIFRTVRESIVTDAEGALLDGVEVYESLPFTGHALTVEDLPQLRKVSYLNGPVNFHAPQNALYETRWACWASATGGFRLLKNATDGTIEPPDDSQGFLSSLTSAVITTEHISAAFDQVSYEVIAWQDGANVKIIRYQNGVPTTKTFEGWSPILFFNGLVNIQAKIDGTTDVVCYYIRRGSGAIYARFQRDNFDDEYVIGGFPHLPLLLLTVENDGLIHRITGMDDGYRKMVLTATYPEQPEPPPDPYVSLFFGEAVGVGAEATDVEDTCAIIEPPAIQEAAGAGASVADIESENVAPPPTDFYEGGQAVPSVHDIAYEVVIVSDTPPGESAGAGVSLQNIAYEQVAVETAALQEQAGAAPSVEEIYYGP